jgi:hypothetical protein
MIDDYTQYTHIRVDREDTDSYMSYRLEEPMRWDELTDEYIDTILPGWELIGCMSEEDMEEDYDRYPSPCCGYVNWYQDDNWTETNLD